MSKVGQNIIENIKKFFTNRKTIEFIISVAIMAVIALAFFAPDASQGHVLQQHDTMQGVANGQELQAYKQATGEDSYWTNSLFSGMPAFQISPTYSSNFLMRWINSIYGLGLPSPSNLLFMMMFGFFILLTVLKVKTPLALTGAVAFGFSTYFIIIIGAGHIWKFMTLSYVAPTIAGIILCYKGKRLLGGSLTALFAMMQIDSNHVQMTYYFLFVIFGVVIATFVTAFRKKEINGWLKSTAVLVVAGILSVSANLPSLYMTKEYSKSTMRGGHSELKSDKTDGSSAGLDKDYITAWSYGIDETVTLLIPNVKGGATIKPEKGQNKFLSLYEEAYKKDNLNTLGLPYEQTQALTQFSQYFGDQPMTNGPVYVGALIFALFVLGCIIVKGPVKWVLSVLTILSILLSWGHNFMPLTDMMIDYFPMYNKFRTVSSILVIAEFTIPLLAVLALQRLFTDKDSLKRYKKPVLWSFGVTLFVCLIGIFIPSFFGSYLSDAENQAYMSVLNEYAVIFSAVEKVRMSMVSGDSLRSFMIVAIGLAIIYLTLKGKIKQTIGMMLIFVVVAGDLYSINKRYVNHDSFTSSTNSDVSESFPLREVDKAILQDTTQNYRVADLSHMGEAAPSFYHKTIGGYHAAKLTRYQDILDNLSQQKCDMLNAKYFISGDTAVSVNPNAMGNAWFVDKIEYVATPNEEMTLIDSLDLRSTAVADKQFLPALGNSAPKSVGDTIFETTYAPNRLTYHAKTNNGGVAVFSEVFFPWGWKAEIDGKEAEIGRVNYILRAINVPAGEHTIVMTFAPKSITTTVAIAKTAIWIIYLLLIFSVATLLVKKNNPIETEKNQSKKDN